MPWSSCPPAQNEVDPKNITDIKNIKISKNFLRLKNLIPPTDLEIKISAAMLFQHYLAGSRYRRHRPSFFLTLRRWSDNCGVG